MRHSTFSTYYGDAGSVAYGMGPLASAPKNQIRRGITLLEVVISLAIFMVALAALNQLVNIGSERALQVQLQAKASLLCQSKLAEMTVGAEPLNGVGWTAIDGEDEGWQWSAEAKEQMAGLYAVRVSVKFETPMQLLTECSLGQMVMPPTSRGTTFDQPTNGSSGSSGSGKTNSANSSNSGSDTTSGSTGSGGTTTGASTTGGTTTSGATKTGGGSSPTPTAPSTPTPSTPAPTQGGKRP